MTNNRLLYIDNIKAFTITLVVIGHVCSSIWGDKTGASLPLYTAIYSFHMPLFMFLSGFCTYISRKKESIWGAYKKKSKQLLWPYILWGVITCFIYRISPVDNVLLELHGGYWFLLCLFEIFVVYYILKLLLYQINPHDKLWIDGAFWICVIILIYLIYNGISLSKADRILNLDMFNLHFKWFIFGVVFAKVNNKYDLAKYGKFLFCVSFICFFVLIVLKIQYIDLLPHPMLWFYLQIPTFGILLVYNYFYMIEMPQKMQKIFSEVGKHTLEIYVLHLLLLPRYGDKTVDGNFLFQYKDNFLISLVICIIAALVLMLLCYLIYSVIEKNQVLRNFLWGR